MAVVMLVTAMLVMVMVVVIMVVAMLMAVVVTAMILFGMIVATMTMRFVRVALAGVGATFGVEGRFNLNDTRAETRHHRLDDVIAANP